MCWRRLAAFALVLAPWIVRNEVVSGTPFGTAGYAVVEGTLCVSAVSTGTFHPSGTDTGHVGDTVCCKSFSRTCAIC